MMAERGGARKPNPEPVIYKCDEFQSIDTLSLNPVDEFNPNLLCYIPECECNNNHKHDRVKYFLKEDANVMVEMINVSLEPVKYTKVKVICNAGKLNNYPMFTLTNEA